MPLTYHEEMRSAVILGIAVALALAVRVIPAYHAVFQPSGVSFQDNDSWYHARSIQNLAAHFPHESGFDPYDSFPGGQVHQSEPWDMAVAFVAWLLGAGKPGAQLVDEVAAWLPAILGAMLPIPVFLLGRRLFGGLAGQLSALSVAIIPGPLLWTTHLGIPDHHVAESVLSLVALVSLCYAVEGQGRARVWLTATAGIVFGAYLCVRPAGIFVPAALALAALAAPSLAPMILAALALASAVFFSVSAGALWSQFTALALAGSILICAVAWALGTLWRRQRWHRAFLLPAAGVGLLVALGIVYLVKPATLIALASTVSRYLPGHDVSAAGTVRELSTLWYAPGRSAFAAVYDALGGVWLVALPVLLCAIPVAWRARRPALTLCAIWCLVMALAGTLQLRMLVYAGPCVALAAGAGAAWLIGKTRNLQLASYGIFVLFLLATSLPAAIHQAGVNNGPDADWSAALIWLRVNSPEPMGDAAAWQRLWPRLRPGETFRYPDSAYGVLTWWDFGDWVSAIAHRLPTTNGNQTNADKIAAFLTDTSPSTAHSQLQALGARYVVLDPLTLTGFWHAIVNWGSGENGLYRKQVYGTGRGKALVPVIIYLPEYYRSMAARLYMFDGKATPTRSQISVFTTRHGLTTSGKEYEGLISVRTFPTDQKAWQYMEANSGETMTLGSTDPTVSCVDLEDLPWIRRVFASAATPLQSRSKPRAVKIFEVER